MWSGDFAWHSGWMGLGGLLFWGLVIATVVFLVRSGPCCRQQGKDADKSALDILEERYARGEIDQAEFEQKRRDFER